MSSRPGIRPHTVLNKADISVNQTSEITIIAPLSLVSYSLTWAGVSPLGVVAVQVSNDYSENLDGTPKNAGTWNTLPLSAPTAVSGNTGTGFIDIDANAGFALRLTYTATSGTGTMTAILSAKVA